MTILKLSANCCQIAIQNCYIVKASLPTNADSVATILITTHIYFNNAYSASDIPVIRHVAIRE